MARSAMLSKLDPQDLFADYMTTVRTMHLLYVAYFTIRTTEGMTMGSGRSYVVHLLQPVRSISK